MKPYDAQVIIIGAGPSGSLAAYELAVQGIPVLVIEKSPFPRYKVCGGGLTLKTLPVIPFDISPVVESTISSVRFSNQFSHVFTRQGDVPLMVCTMRERLDAFLAGEAQKAGAVFIFGETAREINPADDGIEVLAKSRTFRSRLVIGTDGATGLTARTAGLWHAVETGMAWEAEVMTGQERLSQYTSTVFLDWGTFPGGYGWVFPKKDHFSIGVGGPSLLAGWMKPYFDRFIAHLTPELGIHEIRSLRSWPIPVRTDRGRFSSGAILIAGDGAGLSDPLTGEGIYYAVRSGRMAAEACAAYLGGDPRALDDYSGRVNEELMPELLESRRIGNLFEAIPLRIHCWMEREDRVWRAFGKVLRGERNYRDVRKGFGRLRFLWGTVTALAGMAGRVREKRFSKKGFGESLPLQ